MLALFSITVDPRYPNNWEVFKTDFFHHEGHDGHEEIKNNLSWKQHLYFSLGAGISPLGGGGAFNVGGKLYLAPEEQRFRPRISCYYGTNTIVEEDNGYYYDNEYTKLKNVFAVFSCAPASRGGGLSK